MPIKQAIGPTPSGPATWQSYSSSVPVDAKQMRDEVRKIADEAREDARRIIAEMDARVQREVAAKVKPLETPRPTMVSLAAVVVLGAIGAIAAFCFGYWMGH